MATTTTTAALPTDSLKLPPIPVPRGRSPGSSPDVRRRSKEREQQRKLRSAHQTGDHHGFRLPRLFRNRSMSTTTTTTVYLAHSLTNLSEITGGAESSDDGAEMSGGGPGGGGGYVSPPCQGGSRKASKNFDIAKWPVMKTLSAASTKQQLLYQQQQRQHSASSIPSGRRSPMMATGGSSASTTPITSSSLVATDGDPIKQRSQSHSHKFPFSFAFTFGAGSGSGAVGSSGGGDHNDDRQTPFKNVHDSKGNWIGFVERNPNGGHAQAWNNQTTFFTRAKSADDILQLFVVDDMLEM